MSLYERLRPLLFRLPPESAHSIAHTAMAVADRTPLPSVLRRKLAVDDDRLRVEAFGETFPNPVGVAAGFDKNAQVPRTLRGLGFGHVEVGGVTPRPQSGNPRPRVFRLVEDEGLVNRMGLNNQGADVVGKRLRSTDVGYPVGVNLAKNEMTPAEDAPADYRRAYEQVKAGGDFFVVNVSCPNSEGFRELGNRETLEAILGELRDAGAAPLLVKLSPDLPEPALEETIELVEEYELEGVIATNTSTARPDSLESASRVEEGGLSGKPIEETATETVRFVARRTDVPVIGVGGVFTAADAYRKIRAGASMVQLYTAFVFRGPTVARDINRGLATLLERDGFDSVEDAVGVDL